jgi:hypothetical protein
MAVPSPRTWIDREMPPYSLLNAEVYSTLAWLLQAPMCKVRQTTAQALASGVTTTLNFQTEDIDPYNFHNLTNPSRITPTFPGWYRCYFSVGMGALTVGNIRWALARKNAGGTNVFSRRDSKPPTTSQNKSIRGVPFFVQMNGTTDYLEVNANQDGGSSMNTICDGIINSEFFCRWWAPL